MYTLNKELTLLKANTILSNLDLSFTLQHLWNDLYPDNQMSDTQFIEILLKGAGQLSDFNTLDVPALTSKDGIKGVIKELRQVGLSPLAHHLNEILTGMFYL